MGPSSSWLPDVSGTSMGLWGPVSDRPLHCQCLSPGTGNTPAEGFAEQIRDKTTALPHALRMAAPPKALQDLDRLHQHVHDVLEILYLGHGISMFQWCRRLSTWRPCHRCPGLSGHQIGPAPNCPLSVRHDILDAGENQSVDSRSVLGRRGLPGVRQHRLPVDPSAVVEGGSTLSICGQWRPLTGRGLIGPLGRLP